MESRLKGKPRTVVMSGGAPQSPLMAGFLYALWDEGRTFTKFHTSGAGALMALLFLSPSKRFKDDPGDALQNWVEAGVADEIYRNLPQNFKLFHKPGPFAPIFNRLADRFKIPIKGVPPRTHSDPVNELMAEALAPLEGYESQLGKTLRKDPIEQLRDALRALWLPKEKSSLKDDLLSHVDPIRRLREKWLMSWLTKEEDRRLYNDMVDLWFSALTPSTLTSRSLGMAAPLPFLDELVDFGRLRSNLESIDKKEAHLCVNAYNITLDAKLRSKHRNDGHSKGESAQHRDRCKEREEDRPNVMQFFYEPYKGPAKPKDPDPDGHYPIDAEGIRAAFSMPFIYPPARIGEDYFSEGADHEPINLRHVVNRKEYPFVLLDVLGELEDFLVRKPRDLWDSYVISIMTPVVALANEDISDFKDRFKKDDKDTGKGKGNGDAHWCDKMLVVEWDIPSEAQPFVMDWSRSNMKTLFDVGKEAGRDFLKRHKNDLAPHPLSKPKAKSKATA